MDQLEKQRRQIADSLFERYEFGSGVTVEGFNGWEDTDSDDWIRVVFVSFDDDGEGEPSHKVSFHAVFEENDAQVLEAYALLVSNGSEIGRAVH